MHGVIYIIISGVNILSDSLFL